MVEIPEEGQDGPRDLLPDDVQNLFEDKLSPALDHVLDALDIETFLVCSSAEEGRRLAEQLLAELNLPHGDIVFLEHAGPGARVRLRVYVHRPGDAYRWLEGK